MVAHLPCQNGSMLVSAVFLCAVLGSSASGELSPYMMCALIVLRVSMAPTPVRLLALHAQGGIFRLRVSVLVCFVRQELTQTWQAHIVQTVMLENSGFPLVSRHVCYAHKRCTQQRPDRQRVNTAPCESTRVRTNCITQTVVHLALLGSSRSPT